MRKSDDTHVNYCAVLQICMLLWSLSMLWSMRRTLLPRVVPLLRGAVLPQHPNHGCSRSTEANYSPRHARLKVCPLRVQGSADQPAQPPLTRDSSVSCAGDMVLLLCRAGDQMDPAGPDAHPGAGSGALPHVMPAVLPQLPADCAARHCQSRARPDQPDP